MRKLVGLCGVLALLTVAATPAGAAPPAGPPDVVPPPAPPGCTVALTAFATAPGMPPHGNAVAAVTAHCPTA